MTVHHSIIKKAAAKGVILAQDAADQIEAHLTEANIRVTFGIEDPEDATGINELANNALAAVLEMRDYMAEHSDTSLNFEDGDFVAYSLNKKGKRGEEIARDPVLEDLFETLAETAAEGSSEGEEDEPEDRGSVVPERYKKEYAARGDATNCGDWLALLLNSYCHVTDETGKKVTDIDRLETIANANDISPARYGKLGVETNGWSGRYRMTVRNMMVPRVCAKGFLFIPDGVAQGDQEVAAPAEWIAIHSAKPKPVKAPRPETAVTKDAPSRGRKAAKETGEEGLKEANRALRAAEAKKAAA